MTDIATDNAILVPVDFSFYSETALLKACEFASLMKYPVVAVHVVHDPSDMPGYYAKMTKKKHLVRMEDVAQEMLDEFLDEMIAANPKNKCLKNVERMLVVGLPVSRILEVADSVNASMIVMGSQGRTGLKHMMLGSKAEQIVRLAQVPVTIVKAKKSTK